MENKQLAENINKICKRKGITISKLSKDLNLSSGYISEIKNKDRTPSIKKVLEIAEYLEVSIDYLVDREKTENTYIANQGNVKGNNTQNINSQNDSNRLEPLEQELLNQFRKYPKVEQLDILKKLEESGTKNNEK